MASTFDVVIYGCASVYYPPETGKGMQKAKVSIAGIVLINFDLNGFIAHFSPPSAIVAVHSLGSVLNAEREAPVPGTLRDSR